MTPKLVFLIKQSLRESQLKHMGTTELTLIFKYMAVNLYGHKYKIKVTYMHVKLCQCLHVIRTPLSLYLV